MTDPNDPSTVRRESLMHWPCMHVFSSLSAKCLACGEPQVWIIWTSFRPQGGCVGTVRLTLGDEHRSYAFAPPPPAATRRDPPQAAAPDPHAKANEEAFGELWREIEALRRERDYWRGRATRIAATYLDMPDERDSWRAQAREYAEKLARA